jgi:hypothetical protein
VHDDPDVVRFARRIAQARSTAAHPSPSERGAGETSRLRGVLKKRVRLRRIFDKVRLEDRGGSPERIARSAGQGTALGSRATVHATLATEGRTA